MYWYPCVKWLVEGGLELYDTQGQRRHRAWYPSQTANSNIFRMVSYSRRTFGFCYKLLSYK